MKKYLSALIFIWLLLWSILVFADSHHVKPAIWACDPGIVTYNCIQMGLPVPEFALPFWEKAGKKAHNYGSKNKQGIFGSTSPTWQTSPTGSCLYFDGTTNCYISLGTYDPPNAVTVVVGAKKFADNTPYRLFGFHDAFEAFFGWTTDIVANQLFVAAGYVGSSAIYTSSSWYHLAFPSNLTTHYVANYINGVLDGFSDTKGDDDPGSGELRIGQQTGGAGNYFKGWIEYFYVFPVELNASQIQTLYNNPYGMFEPIPMAWYIGGAPPTGLVTPFGLGLDVFEVIQ